jgi:23S rRNA (uridine2552-2'-O)-methyltransferase
MSYQYQDHYFHRAKKERFLARAVYKLQEIQRKHKVLKKGDRVLDLGAAPGSWMQFTQSVIGPTGHVLGIDLQPIEHPFPKWAVTLQGDIFDAELLEELKKRHAPFDVILSDMAPKTSGIKVADAARSALLVERAMEIAEATLAPSGHFLVKIFQGPEFHQILSELKQRFARTRVIKPDASRKNSKEIYILAMNYRGRAA